MGGERWFPEALSEARRQSADERVVRSEWIAPVWLLGVTRGRSLLLRDRPGEAITTVRCPRTRSEMCAGVLGGVRGPREECVYVWGWVEGGEEIGVFLKWECSCRRHESTV